MFRSFKILASVSMLSVLAACGSTEIAPSDGKALSSLSPEPAGTECPSGGTRIATGLDLDGNGTLDPTEVKSSQVVCNGASGKDGATGAKGADGANGSSSASLLTLEEEGPGANCAAGGTRIQSGLDKDGNQLLDPGEVTATRFVCNGGNGNGGDVVSVYNFGSVSVGSKSVTVLHARIAAPGKGKVVAFSNADIYCSLPATSQGQECNSAGITAGFYTLATSPDADPMSGAHEYFHLSPNETESSSRTAVFEVTEAGDVDVYLRSFAHSGGFGFFRSSLTLIFIPA